VSHEQKRLQDEAIARLSANIARYRKGELTPDQFRPLRLGMGLYAQLPHVKHMLRIKIPGGVLTADQLDALSAGDDFKGVDTEAAFGFRQTPFEDAVRESYCDPRYSHVLVQR